MNHTDVMRQGDDLHIRNNGKDLAVERFSDGDFLIDVDENDSGWEHDFHGKMFISRDQAIALRDFLNDMLAIDSSVAISREEK